MGIEYRIKWHVPDDYNPAPVLRKLPSPIGKAQQEIYNFSIEKDGFYFLDHLVDERIAGEAMKLLVDEGLKYVDEVIIREL